VGLENKLYTIFVNTLDVDVMTVGGLDVDKRMLHHCMLKICSQFNFSLFACMYVLQKRKYYTYKSFVTLINVP
jgi:hypothetical protein